MRNVLLLRYGEIHLKGNNRGMFEKTLLTNLRSKIKEGTVQRTTGRYLICDYKPEDEQLIIDKVKTVFGIVSLSRAVEFETNQNDIESYVSKIDIKGEFRVTVKRANKNFPINSDEYSKILGGIVLKANKDAIVNLHNPKTIINVEIRENGNTYVYFENINCLGGMPVGTAGKGLLLLSGGIDSPVAGYMMSKRGMTLNALHFHSYPYTSNEAKEKVVELRNIIENYCGKIKMFVCSFTEIQEEIHKHCSPEFMITIMRRIMMRIAERICNNNKIKAIITGECLAQVASQTIESLTSTNMIVKTIPILRPLVAFDKQEIIEIANRIGTFDTSILPYEDCCTVFLPKNPVIHPKIYQVEAEEKKLDIEKLVDNAINSIEIIN